MGVGVDVSLAVEPAFSAGIWLAGLIWWNVSGPRAGWNCAKHSSQ